MRSRTILARNAAVLLAALSAPAAAATQAPVQKEPLESRYEALAAAGDDAKIEALFRERPYEVIFLVDGALEGWLARLEEGAAEDGPDTRALLERALAAARRADAAFETDAFSRYAKAWQGWTAQQRLQFRAGQAAFRKAREAQKAKDYETARAACRESLAIATPLQDAWGIAQAEQCLGDLAVGEGDADAAIRHHEKALEVFGSLRHPQLLRSCRALGDLYEKQGDPKRALEHLERMVEVANRAGRPEAADPVKADIQRLRKELESP